MKGQCCICTELFQLNSDISATQCGHTFHAVCLRQWLEQSKTCPQCRNKVNERHIVAKLYFDAAEDSGDDEEDVPALKNQLSDLKIRVKETKRERKLVEKEKEAIEMKMTELRESFRTMEQLYRQERNNISTLKRELQFHKELQKEALVAREESKMLKTKLVDLKHVERMVNGNEDEIRSIIATGDVRGLATWCGVLQKELHTKRQESRTLRETCDKLKKETSVNKRLAAERQVALSTEQTLNESYREQIQDGDKEVMNLKKKINALEKAIGSPTDTVRSFAHRLMHESPAPMMTPPPNKKPKLSDPGADLASPDMFISPALSRRDCVEEVDESPSVQCKKDCEEFGTKYVKITSASQASVKRKAPEMSDISNIHGLGSFNIMRKKTGMGLIDSCSAIRKGYNGFGGHEKFIKTNTFKAPAPVKMVKKQPKFGPSRAVTMVTAVKTPVFPSLDNFLADDL